MLSRFPLVSHLHRIPYSYYFPSKSFVCAGLGRSSIARETRTACSRALMATSTGDPEKVVLHSINNGVASVVLNRPKALNSLNTEMVESLLQLYRQWNQPGSGVACIVIKGAGEKAFCAGGDVKQVVLDAMAGRLQPCVDFFRTEYTLNRLVAESTPTYIALMDGIVMGGGNGVSVHGHFRVATERTLFAMPECDIGLVPDVGASFFLQHLPANLGVYLGVTGARLTGPEMREVGLATHFVPSSALPALEAALQQLGPRAGDAARVQALLDGFEVPRPGANGLAAKLRLAQQHFHHNRVEDIRASLEAAAAASSSGGSGGSSTAVAEVAELARRALQSMDGASPLSQKLTLELLRRARGRPLPACLALEFQLVQRCSMGEGDFVEGVRAKLIDRRGQPARWRYGSLLEVPDHVVAEFFTPRPGRDQQLWGTEPLAKL